MPGYSGRSRLMGGRGRGKRTFKKRAVRQMDTPHQNSKSKLVTNGGPIAFPTKDIYVQPLTGLIQGDTRDQRERNIVWFKGIRIRASFRNTLNAPLWCHMAIINPKDALDDAGVNNFNGVNFFTPLGSTSRAGLDAGPTLTGLEWGTLPINTETHNVLWHTRFKLGVRFETATQNFTTGAGTPNYRTLSRYIKIGKKLSYKNANGNTCTNPLYLAVWVSYYEEGAASGVSNAMVHQQHITVYFSDPK